MEMRTTDDPHDIARAIDIDQSITGSRERAGYIAAIAERGGLSVAATQGEIRAFCCLDYGYFFGRPFVSLLMVDRGAQRKGLGSGLLRFNEGKGLPELWTSTNRSNAKMRALLEGSGWQFCGELNGLDEDDPELFFKKASALSR